MKNCMVCGGSLNEAEYGICNTCNSEGDNECPSCGNKDYTWRNGSGEMQCDTCGYDEVVDGI